MWWASSWGWDWSALGKGRFRLVQNAGGPATCTTMRPRVSGGIVKRWASRRRSEPRFHGSNCPEHGVMCAAIPWALPHGRFTHSFEAMVIEVVKACASKQTAWVSSQAGMEARSRHHGPGWTPALDWPAGDGSSATWTASSGRPGARRQQVAAAADRKARRHCAEPPQMASIQDYPPADASTASRVLLSCTAGKPGLGRRDPRRRPLRPLWRDLIKAVWGVEVLALITAAPFCVVTAPAIQEAASGLSLAGP